IDATTRPRPRVVVSAEAMGCKPVTFEMERLDGDIMGKLREALKQELGSMLDNLLDATKHLEADVRKTLAKADEDVRNELARFDQNTRQGISKTAADLGFDKPENVIPGLQRSLGNLGESLKNPTHIGGVTGKVID